MKWTRKSIYGKLDDMKAWHTWFAWYPVTLDLLNRERTETVVWLEKVKRRKVFGRISSWWEYRKYDPVSGLRNNDVQQGESV